jgi:TRAP-type mannitol/chloroaromatic compound transport system substrate-binding protein
MPACRLSQGLQSCRVIPYEAGRPCGSKRQGSLGGGWNTVRRKVGVIGVLAAVLGMAAGNVMAGEPDAPGARIIQMQTAFNPGLPGAGEGVRSFTKTLKHMSAGALAVKIVEPGRIAPTKDMLDAIVAGDLEAAFTWSGYAISKAPVFGLFGTVPFGPGPSVMSSWLLDGNGGKFHHDAYDRLGVAGMPCGVQGSKGGGWFRADLNTPEDFKGVKLRYGKISGDVITKMGATLAPLAAGDFFYHLQQGKVDGGEMSTPAMDAALGFDKLGLPYYMPGWQQPSAVIDFLMRKDKWEGLPAAQRAQIETACRANIALMLSRSPHTQALALEKLRASGVVIKPWSPSILQAFRKNADLVLKERAEMDAEFAAAWADQKKYVAQGMDWRTMSRLP